MRILGILKKLNAIHGLCVVCNTNGTAFRRNNISAISYEPLMAVNDDMACLESIHLKSLEKIFLSAVPLRDRGAITVEYALCMVVVAVLMIGVEVMFSNMAVEIINRFKNIVLSFPNI